MVSKGKDNLDRWEKVKSRTSHMDAVRESYNPIVPSNQANKGPQSCPRHGHRLEESDQERGLAKGKVVQPPTTGTQSSGKKVSRGLIGVREAAERDRELHFEELPPPAVPNMAQGVKAQKPKRQTADMGEVRENIS